MLYCRPLIRLRAGYTAPDFLIYIKRFLSSLLYVCVVETMRDRDIKLIRLLNITKNKMKIGITGATGQLGRLVVDKLKTIVPKEDMVALVRSTQKASDLGIEAREADYDKSETLEPALEGIDHLMFISASEIGKRTKQHERVIAAAKKSGVKWIVYTSLLHADQSSVDLAVEHKATEEMLEKSGIPYTFLRNGWYNENYNGSIAGAVASGSLVGSAGNGKISSASRADYAEAAAIVLTTEGHQGKVYELAGDEAWTLSDLAAEISRQSGKEVSYQDMPAEKYADVLKGMNIPEQMAKTIAGWDVAASKNALFDDARQLSNLIGRATTPIAATVSEVLKSKD